MPIGAPNGEQPTPAGTKHIPPGEYDPRVHIPDLGSWKLENCGVPGYQTHCPGVGGESVIRKFPLHAQKKELTTNPPKINGFCA